MRSMNTAADTAAPASTLVTCGFCPCTFPARAGRGAPRVYCDEDCRRGAEALAILARVLPTKARAMVRVMDAIEAIPVDNAALSDGELRAVRAAAFTVANRGRRLAPGTSGRYVRKGRKAPAATASQAG